MAWNKKNLASNKDMTDTWGCDICGFQNNYHIGQRPIECPKCDKKRPAGWWSRRKGSECICGTKGKLVPKEGHPNSEYWRLQREDEELLYYCPAGCLDGENCQDIIKRLRKELKEARK